MVIALVVYIHVEVWQLLTLYALSYVAIPCHIKVLLLYGTCTLYQTVFLSTAPYSRHIHGHIVDVVCTDQRPRPGLRLRSPAFGGAVPLPVESDFKRVPIWHPQLSELREPAPCR